MNFTEVMDALQQASGFDQYRLRSAIDRTLAQPRWIVAAATQLRIGQTVQYFSDSDNALRTATVLDLRRKRVLVLDQLTAKRWLIDYAAINLEGVDVTIREQPASGLGRHEVAVGDTVGFQDREGRQRGGQIVRLNDKTVTLHCDGQNWRVGYGLLHRLIDANSSAGSMTPRS